MQLSDIRVGDVLRVREWDDMAQQYRIDSDGDIDMPQGYFFKAMRITCGSQFIIGEIDGALLYPENTEEFPLIEDGYGYFAEMLEPYFIPDELDDINNIDEILFL